MTNRLLVVLGSGPGIGVATGTKFASEGFDVALLARNVHRLKQDVSTVETAATDKSVKVSAYPVDISDHVAVQQTLKRVEEEMGTPEVVLFNAAMFLWSKIGEIDPEVMVKAYKTMVVGMYAAAAWARPHLISAAQKPGVKPCFFLSGGPIATEPFADLFVLSIQKAAQLNLMGSLSQVLGPERVHVATINIGGAVVDDEPILNAKNIASIYWKLHLQDKAEWEFEVKLADLEYWEEQKNMRPKNEESGVAHLLKSSV